MRTKEELNLGCFEKFIGHSVIIKNDLLNETYCYENFQIDKDTYTNCIALIDGKRDIKTYILYDDIYELVNKDNDLYDDVIYISATHSNYYIRCAEERPVYPRCHKCEKEIKEIGATVWRINGNANYGSHYDGIELNAVVNGLCFCDECVFDFVGSVDELVDSNWLVG